MIRTALKSAAVLANATSGQSLLTVNQMNDIMAEHVSAMNKYNVPFDCTKSHSPSDSLDSIVIPLGSLPESRIRYVNHQGTTRFGRILEDLDAFAVWLAYKHNQGPEIPMGTPNHPPMIAVTACVDKINLQNRVIRSDLDIIMNGMVTWIGRSSAEITMHLTQKFGENDMRDVLTARFLMVTKKARWQRISSKCRTQIGNR